MKNNNTIKILFYLTVISISWACSNSPEDKVKKEFKNYVKTEVNNPSSLKEIVSIIVSDTISYSKFKENASILYERFALMESIDSIYCAQSHDACNKLKNISAKVDNYEREIIQQLINQDIAALYAEENWVFEYGSKKEILESELDSILRRLDGLNLHQFVIKTRFDEDGTLKLKEYYALMDSTSIRILDHKPTFKDYSKDASNFYNVAKQYEELISTRTIIQKKKMEILNKLKTIANTI